MSKPIDRPAEVREALTQNAQKGEPHRIKFIGDPLIYEGIPLARPGWTARGDDTFRFEVTAPEERAGLMQRHVSEVEWLEPVR